MWAPYAGQNRIMRRSIGPWHGGYTQPPLRRVNDCNGDFSTTTHLSSEDCRLFSVEPLPDVVQEIGREHFDHGDGKGAWPVFRHAE
jgi:hypothetical protein